MELLDVSCSAQIWGLKHKWQYCENVNKLKGVAAQGAATLLLYIQQYVGLVLTQLLIHLKESIIFTASKSVIFLHKMCRISNIRQGWQKHITSQNTSTLHYTHTKIDRSVQTESNRNSVYVGPNLIEKNMLQIFSPGLGLNTKKKYTNMRSNFICICTTVISIEKATL